MSEAKTKFEIFAGVPLVKARRFGAGPQGPRESIYPVTQLEVGQAFFVPAGANDVSKLAKTVASSVARLAKASGFKLSVRNLPESDDAEINPWGEAGVGVWRVEGVYVHKPKVKKAA